MNALESEWQRKGATLSDKTARKEFGLAQDEVVAAIQAGMLQYRRNASHGNPFLRLLQREVVTLARAQHGQGHFDNQQAKTEPARVTQDLDWLIRPPATALLYDHRRARSHSQKPFSRSRYQKRRLR